VLPAEEPVGSLVQRGEAAVASLHHAADVRRRLKDVSAPPLALLSTRFRSRLATPGESGDEC